VAPSRPDNGDAPPEEPRHRQTLLEVAAATPESSPDPPPAPTSAPPSADEAPTATPDQPRHAPTDDAAADVARSALGLDEGEPAHGLEVVCPRCGTVQLRAVSCRHCATPLGEYAVATRGGPAWLLDLTDGLRRRGLLWPVAGGGLALLALLVLLLALGGGDGPEGSPAAPAGSTAAAATPTPPPDDEVTLADLEAPPDPRAATLLAKPAADEAPFVAVNRIKSGMYGPLQAQGFTSRKLKKRGRSMVEASLPAGWVLYLSGPEVHRLDPDQRRILAPGRYEMAAELPAESGRQGQPLFLDLYLKAGRKYLVSNRSIHEVMEELKAQRKTRRRRSKRR